MLILALTGCLSEVLTESGELRVVAADLKIIGSGSLTAPMLAGTVTCPEIHCNGLDCTTDELALLCFHQEVVGDASLVDGCLTFGSPGFVQWKFLAQDCEAAFQGYTPTSDQLTFAVVGTGRVHAEAVDVEQFVELLLDPGSGSFPQDWHMVRGQPVQVMAGAPFRFFPVLLDDIGLEVGWTLAHGEASASGGITAEWDPVTQTIEVLLEEGQGGELDFQVADSPTWLIHDLEAVSASAPDALHVVVAYARDSISDRITPVGARAVVRDKSGELVWGTPVEWTLDEGLLAVGDPYVLLPGGDYVTLLDACVPPDEGAGPRRAVLRASYGDLTATADLAWYVAESDPNPLWAASPHCVEGQGPPATDPTNDPNAPGDPDDLVPTDFITGAGGCRCAGSGPSPLPLLFGVLALTAARRRRPRSGE